MNRIPAPSRDDVIQLEDGRMLAFMEWGAVDGRPILLFHGSPGCRLFCPDPESTRTAGARLITVDRPGYGRSDPQPGRTLRDWPSDIAILMDTLGIDRAGVVGFSAGGRHALACAALLPDRFVAAAVAGGAGASFDEWPDGFLDDEDRALALLVREDKARAEEVVASAEWIRGLVEKPESLLSEGDTPEADMWFLENEPIRRAAESMLREAMRQGPQGLAGDWLALVDVWGFRLKDVVVPTTFFHGAHDQLEPAAAADFAVAMVPDARLVEWSDAGHMGLIPHWKDVLDSVA